MRHPFEGIIVPKHQDAQDVSRSAENAPGESNRDDRPTNADRRSFLRGLSGLGALVAVGGAAIVANRQLAAQEPQSPRFGPDTPPPPADFESQPRPAHREDHSTTQALGEEGGQGNDPDRPTTYALGEEGGQSDRPTTYATGEEGGQGDDGRYTTQALGEEGSSGDEYGRYTTYATGEEGAQGDRYGRYTTYALGEEGSYGGGYYRRRYYVPRSYRQPWPWYRRRPGGGTYTTQAIGEEGGVWY